METFMRHPLLAFVTIFICIIFNQGAFGVEYDLLRFEYQNPEVKQSKIVGLVQMRNESLIIEQCLRGMAEYTDSIVILDDASEDSSVEIAKNLAVELNIERIICNKQSGWEQATEMDLRDLLISTARSIGATHFIQLDADELISAECMKNDWLRNKILSLKKGQVLSLPMIHPWKTLSHYRDDHSRWSPQKCMCAIAMCDDGASTVQANKSHSHSGFIHMGRFPSQRPGGTIYDRDVNHCVIHFRFVNWKNIMIKRAWYMCLERIRLQENLSERFKNRTIEDINNFYSKVEPFNERRMKLKPVKLSWYNYPFFNGHCYMKEIVWRKNKIKSWFKRYGHAYFQKLDIWKWGIDWK
jgi:Glycosyl transferase family 2